MRRTMWVCLLALLGALLAAVVTLPAAQETTTPAAEQAKPESPEAAVPQVIPEEAKNRKNPVRATEKSIAAGRQLFSSQCRMCHGVKGDGKGDLAEEINLSVPDFTDARVQAKRTDGELFYILTQGHGEMPGQGKRMREAQKWNIINFIRSLAPQEKGGSEKN